MGLGRIVKNLFSKASFTLVAGALAAMTSFGAVEEAKAKDIQISSPEVSSIIGRPHVTCSIDGSTFFTNPATIGNGYCFDEQDVGIKKGDEDLGLNFNVGMGFNDFTYGFGGAYFGLNGQNTYEDRIGLVERHRDDNYLSQQGSVDLSFSIDLGKGNNFGFGFYYRMDSNAEIDINEKVDFDEFERVRGNDDDESLSAVLQKLALIVKLKEMGFEQDSVLFLADKEFGITLGDSQTIRLPKNASLSIGANINGSYGHYATVHLSPKVDIDIDNLAASKLEFADNQTTIYGFGLRGSVGFMFEFENAYDLRVGAVIRTPTRFFTGSGSYYHQNDLTVYRGDDKPYFVEAVSDPFSIDIGASIRPHERLTIATSLWDDLVVTNDGKVSSELELGVGLLYDVPTHPNWPGIIGANVSTKIHEETELNGFASLRPGNGPFSIYCSGGVEIVDDQAHPTIGFGVMFDKMQNRKQNKIIE
jgi:hypothetical protein